MDDSTDRTVKEYFSMDSETGIIFIKKSLLMDDTLQYNVSIRIGENVY